MDAQLKNKVEILKAHGFVDLCECIDDSGTHKIILKFPGVSMAYWPVFWTDWDLIGLKFDNVGDVYTVMRYCGVNADPDYGDWRKWSDEKLIKVISDWKLLLMVEAKRQYNREIETALEAL